MKRAASIIAVVLSVGCVVAGWRGRFDEQFAQLFGTTRTGYASSGLVLRLDGIENTRAGHSSSPTKWENLAPSGATFDFTMGGGNTWGEDHCQFVKAQNNIGRMTTALAAAGVAGFTVELVWAKTAADTGYNFGLSSRSAVSSWTGVQVFRNTGDWPSGNYTVGANATSAVISHAFVGGTPSAIMYTALTLSPSASVAYVAGTNALTAACSQAALDAVAARNKYSLGHDNFSADSNAANNLIGKIYAVRIYTRALSADEIAANHAIDQSRFGAE